MKNEFIKNKISSQKKQVVNKKKDKSRKIATIILAVLILFWSLGSVLGSLSFLKQKGIISVSADESVSSVSFIGSRLYFPTTQRFTALDSDSYLDYMLFRCDFTSNNVDNVFNVKFDVDFMLSMMPINHNEEVISSNLTNYQYVSGDNNAIPDLPGIFYLNDINLTLSELESYGNSVHLIGRRMLVRYNTYDADNNYELLGARGSREYYIQVAIKSDGIMFNSDIDYIMIGSNLTGNLDGYHYVRYVSITGQYIEFRIITEQTDGALNTRTYFVNSSGDGEFSQGYEQGVKDGYTQAENTIGKEQYQLGYDYGSQDGYYLGYEAGLDASNQYSFFNLLGAVIDAPVQAISGLLNFEILGVDIGGFFMGLMTLALVLLVVRIFL